MNWIWTRSLRSLTPLAALAVLVLAGCGGTSDDDSADASGDGGGSTKLTLVAYSTPEEAYKELIPAFAKTPKGKGVSFMENNPKFHGTAPNAEEFQKAMAELA